MKIIFLTSYDYNDSRQSGGLNGSKKNFALLKELSACKEIRWIFAPQTKQTFFRKALSVFLNYGIGKNVYDEVKELIKNGFDVLFCECGISGGFIKKIHKEFKKLLIIRFFHDCLFFQYQSFKKNAPIISFGRRNKIFLTLISKRIKGDEKKSIKYCNYVGCLSRRDSELLEAFFRHKADFYIPVSLPEKEYKEHKVSSSFNNEGIVNLLFVGVLSYLPNLEAMRFFCQKVVPHINCRINIIGTDSEKYRNEFPPGDKINLIGSVSDLEPYYITADAIVAPLFSGSGMKVKICEALAYGKTIFATKEAFAGYDIDYEKVGGICNNAEEFIFKINSWIPHRQKYNPYSKQVFLEKYTNEAVLDNLNLFFNSIKTT